MRLTFSTFDFPIGAASAYVKSAIAHPRVFARRVADAGEQSISNESLALADSADIPKLQGHRATSHGDQRDGALPEGQAFENWRVVEPDVERQDCGPREANPSVIFARTLLLAEARTLCSSWHLFIGLFAPQIGIGGPIGDPLGKISETRNCVVGEREI